MGKERTLVEHIVERAKHKKHLTLLQGYVYAAFSGPQLAPDRDENEWKLLLRVYCKGLPGRVFREEEVLNIVRKVRDGQREAAPAEQRGRARRVVLKSASSQAYSNRRLRRERSESRGSRRQETKLRPPRSDSSEAKEKQREERRREREEKQREREDAEKQREREKDAERRRDHEKEERRREREEEDRRREREQEEERKQKLQEDERRWEKRSAESDTRQYADSNWKKKNAESGSAQESVQKSKKNLKVHHLNDSQGKKRLASLEKGRSVVVLRRPKHTAAEKRWLKRVESKVKKAEEGNGQQQQQQELPTGFPPRPPGMPAMMPPPPVPPPPPPPAVKCKEGAPEPQREEERPDVHESSAPKQPEDDHPEVRKKKRGTPARDPLERRASQRSSQTIPVKKERNPSPPKTAARASSSTNVRSYTAELAKAGIEERRREATPVASRQKMETDKRTSSRAHRSDCSAYSEYSDCTPRTREGQQSAEAWVPTKRGKPRQSKVKKKKSRKRELIKRRKPRCWLAGPP